jgi:hypothetical protein
MYDVVAVPSGTVKPKSKRLAAKVGSYGKEIWVLKSRGTSIILIMLM